MIALDAVISHLRELSRETSGKLKNTDSGREVLIDLKKQTDIVVQLLSACQKYQIDPFCTIKIIPDSKDHFGDYILVDVGENNGIDHGTILKERNGPLFLSGGDIIIRRPGQQSGLPEWFSGTDEPAETIGNII